MGQDPLSRPPLPARSQRRFGRANCASRGNSRLELGAGTALSPAHPAGIPVGAWGGHWAQPLASRGNSRLQPGVGTSLSPAHPAGIPGWSGHRNQPRSARGNSWLEPGAGTALIPAHPAGIPAGAGTGLSPAVPGRVTPSVAHWQSRGRGCRGCSFITQSAEKSRSPVRGGNWIYFHPTRNRFSGASERLFYKANSNQAVH